MKPQVIVVEGLHDQTKIRRIYPDAFVIITQGSAVDDHLIDQLKSLENTHDIILFLDSDQAGERIRRILSRSLTRARHAFIQPEKSRSKNQKKIGIEHASESMIKEALKNVITEVAETISDVDFQFLFEMKLVGHLNSQSKRKILTQKFHMGHANGKTLLYKIHRFNITRKQIVEVFK